MVFLEYLENLPRFRFLGLPAELRTPIFKCLFADCVHFASDKNCAVSKSAVSRHVAKPKLTRAILQTCRQLRKEGISILFQSVLLELQSLSGGPLMISTFGRHKMHLFTKLYLPVH
jgi:hypothetical protein